MIRSLAAIALLIAGPALAHMAMTGQQYDAFCCSPVNLVEDTGDCAPIDASHVQITPEGYLVTLTAADHPRVRESVTQLFRYPDANPANDRELPPGRPEARESNDDEFHACVLPNSQQFRCLLVPRANG